MTGPASGYRPAKLLLTAAAFAIIDSSALAQPADTAAEKEIVVEAPRAVPPPAGRSPYSGAPVVVTTVRISALYGDLDLSKPDDAARLMVRIERVARDACSYLDRLHPLSSDADCVDKAVAGAGAAAKAVIAAGR